MMYNNPFSEFLQDLTSETLETSNSLPSRGSPEDVLAMDPLLGKGGVSREGPSLNSPR